MDELEQQDQRIEAIVGSEVQDSPISRLKFYDYLRKHLVLPCEVTGIEDFRWEERYVIGPGDPQEYQRLRQTRPSFRDRYDLVAIEYGPFSQWMLFGGDDLAAHVKRKSDGKEFVLGLSELKATDKHSPNRQLLQDFSVFLVNNR